jgi:hypothetical protein
MIIRSIVRWWIIHVIVAYMSSNHGPHMVCLLKSGLILQDHKVVTNNNIVTFSYVIMAYFVKLEDKTTNFIDL